MTRLTGRQAWKLRTKHGKDKLFSDAKLLWEEASAYFDWCDRNPWERVELVKSKLDYQEVDVPLGRPYTIDGLTVFLGVSGSYFRSAKRNMMEKIGTPSEKPENVELLETIERIESVCRNQQIEGAAVGVFNGSIIARLNGLADTVNNNNTGDPIIKVVVRDQETADNLDKLSEDLS